MDYDKFSKEDLISELESSKQKIKDLENSVRSQQETIDFYNYHEEFLSKTVMELVQLKISDNIYDFIAHKMKEYVKNSIIVVTVYDQPSDSFIVESIMGDIPKLNEWSQKYLKRDVFNLKVPLSAFEETYDSESKNNILNGKIQLIENGIYQVACKTIPYKIARLFERALDIGEIYGTGFNWKGQIFGTVNIILRRGAKLENKKTLQSLIQLFSVALQRRKAEEELIESEETHRKLLRESFDAWIIHSKGFLVDGNEAAVKIMGGNSIEDFKGKPLLDFVHPEFREIVKKRSSQMYAEGGTVPLMEEKFLRLDGTSIPVQVVATSMKYKGQNAVQVVFRDMTEREKILKSLQQTKEELERIIESSPSAIAVLDMNGRIKLWSPAAEKIFGWKKDEIIGKINPMVPPEHNKLYLEQVEKISKGSQFTLEEVESLTKNGDRIYISLSVSPLLNSKGEVENMLAIMTDITKRKMAEIRLKESENRYRTIFENTGAATILFNKEGLITLTNSEMENVTGYKKEDIQGKRKWMEFVHPEDLPIMMEYNKKREINPESVPNSYEIRIINNKGEIRNAQITVDKIPNMDLYVTSMLDITNLKNAYQQLEESENRFRSMFENNPVAYQCLDVNGILLDMNQPLCELLGYEREELIGRNFKDYCSTVNQEQFHEKFRYLNDKGLVNNQVIEFNTKKGDKKTVLVTCRLQRDTKTNKPIRIHCILTDVTERQKILDQLHDSLKEKEMLLKEIHHRVKNNLMIISSLLNLQSRSIKDKATLSVFRESQNRARSMALIHDRLYRSTDLKRINFGDYIQNLANELFRTYVLDPEKIQLHYDVEDLMVDINTAVPLGLIVNELAANAMKYAYPQGESGKIHICFHKEGENYILRIKDEGVGIPDDLDISQVKTLGLQLVNSLTEQIDGKLDLNRDNGTDFRITFKESEFSN
ncbi:MAG: PAS domain S-box protein [Methanobacteriaceae archaeon]|nr:PAS domain S-box protein [Methanobacteriaceae archaeon]